MVVAEKVLLLLVISLIAYHVQQYIAIGMVTSLALGDPYAQVILRNIHGPLLLT